MAKRTTPRSPLGVEFSQEEAMAVAQEWRRRLGLSEWEVDVRVVPRGVRTRWLGDARIVAERRYIRIRLVVPHLGFEGTPEDAEDTILHELVHIFFEAWRPANERRDRARALAIEHAVCSITSALLAMSRRSGT